MLPIVLSIGGVAERVVSPTVVARRLEVIKEQDYQITDIKVQVVRRRIDRGVGRVAIAVRTAHVVVN